MNRIAAYLMLISLTVFFSWSAFGAGREPAEVRIEPRSLKQGQVALVEVTGISRTALLQGEFDGTGVALAYDVSSASFKGLLGADVDCKPGAYALTLRTGERLLKTVPIYVGEKNYGVRRLSLPPSMTEYDEKTKERIRIEKERTDALWGKSGSTKLWSGPFLMPVKGKVTGEFGTRTFINGEERSPHTGVDLHAEMHEDVRCSNSGRVVLSDDLFFTGKTIVIDHGSGIFTMYFHLSEVFFREGDTVERGRVIGRAGSTGRSTGPHLHWGARLAGARVNPIDLVNSSKRYEQSTVTRGEKGRKNVE